MIGSSLIVGIAFLIFVGIIDVLTYNKKKGFIPSALTTSFLIVTYLIGTSINPGMTIEIGILACLIALLFTDLDLWGGIADFKVFIACSMLMPTIMSFLVFALVLTIVSVFLKFILKILVTKGKDANIPFLLAILTAFIIAGGLSL
jgi:hypothetical protein